MNNITEQKLRAGVAKSEITTCEPGVTVNDPLGFIISLFKEAPKMRHFLTESAFAAASMMGFEAGLLISVSSITWGRGWEFYSGMTRPHCDSRSTLVVYEQLRCQRQAAMMLELSDDELKDIFYRNAQHIILGE